MTEPGRPMPEKKCNTKMPSPEGRAVRKQGEIRRGSRCASSPYWSSGPGPGVTVEGMRSREALDQWSPALPPLRKPERAGDRILLRILEICAGCGSVSTFTAREARELGVHDVQVFSVDGKPGTRATRTADLLTWDWADDAELARFREPEEGATCIYYAHASPPCGPYSTMASRCGGPLDARDLRWGDTVVQRCLELITFFRPDYWTLESRGPPGLDTRCFMRALEPRRATVNYCRYGWQRWKTTSIWTNVQSWVPEPRCLPNNRCAHYREHGLHLDKVRSARGGADFAALPEQLVRAWTRAALTEVLGDVSVGGVAHAGHPGSELQADAE